MFKKVITTLLAADFALGAISCGVKKAEERTLATMSAIEQRIEEAAPDKLSRTVSPYAKQDLGYFSLTFYVPDAKWGRATATGEEPVHLMTCAVDPRIVPYGSVLLVVSSTGKTITVRANDCGSGIIGNKLDIFWDRSISEGYDYFEDFGTIAHVYLLEE
jgi:3D (Asp-Asp-Asp) domain-containing protein